MFIPIQCKNGLKWHLWLNKKKCENPGFLFIKNVNLAAGFIHFFRHKKREGIFIPSQCGYVSEVVNKQ